MTKSDKLLKRMDELARGNLYRITMDQGLNKLGNMLRDLRYNVEILPTSKRIPDEEIHKRLNKESGSQKKRVLITTDIKHFRKMSNRKYALLELSSEMIGNNDEENIVRAIECFFMKMKATVYNIADTGARIYLNGEYFHSIGCTQVKEK
tara:strand:+ start:1049 stop:1498 length:450 start_codon:yes stop_codon:yes gene_type:complete